jgi:hypothetical protein
MEEGLRASMSVINIARAGCQDPMMSHTRPWSIREVPERRLEDETDPQGPACTTETSVQRWRVVLRRGGGGENPVVPKAAAWSVFTPHITFPSLLDEGTSARILSETIYKREAGDTAAESPPSGAVLIAAKLV